MGATQKLRRKYRRLRGLWGKRRRLLFPSPAEVELIRIMGGKVIVIDNIKDPLNGFPLTIVTSMGAVFRAENVRREVRVAARFCDFGNDIQRAIEVDGRQWHQDIVKEQDRDDYFARFGWRILHLPASDLYQNPKLVYNRVRKFLES